MCAAQINGNLLDAVDSQCTCPPQAFDDDLRADALLHGVAELLQYFSG